jgi:PEP-CTERM motif
MNIRTIFGVVALATVLNAEPITFTINGTGSGTVGATAFTDAAFTVTLTTDTTLIEPLGPSAFITPDVSGVGLNIAGFADGTFDDSWAILVAETGDAALSTPLEFDLINGNNAIFATYDLQSSLGPVSLNSPTTFGQFLNIPTSIGDVTINDSLANVTLTAVASDVPEPATLALTALGLLGLMRMRRRRTTCRSNLTHG